MMPLARSPGPNERALLEPRQFTPGGLSLPGVPRTLGNIATGALNGWQSDASPSGRLKLDVNVRAPRGTKVDGRRHWRGFHSGGQGDQREPGR
jgi:hypothetical protein